MSKLFLLTCLLAATLRAAGPEFEVATVKPMPPITAEMVRAGRLRTGINIDKGHVDIAGIPLRGLLAFAYRIPQNQILGPEWLGSERFEIAAKLPDGATEDQVPEMLQALLVERFKLAVHRENKEHAAYVLTVAKGGLKVKEAEPAAEAPVPPADPNAPAAPPNVIPLGSGSVRITQNPSGKGETISGPRTGIVREVVGVGGAPRMEASNITFGGLADILTQMLSIPVVDMTELTGRYQLVLEIPVNEPPPPPSAPGVTPVAAPNFDPLSSLLAAVQKLGLKMESRKLPVETLIVDHIERTPTDN